jgi:hypothetical protein
MEAKKLANDMRTEPTLFHGVFLDGSGPNRPLPPTAGLEAGNSSRVALRMGSFFGSCLGGIWLSQTQQ